MLKATSRYILYFDLAMAPHPSDAPALPLQEFVPYLQKRSEAGSACQVIDNERRVIRLSAIKQVRTKGGKPAIALLLNLGDRDKADPGFTNFATGKVRIPKRHADEAGGLSVHAVLCTRPTQDGGHLYRMVYEDVSGFGRTLIQSFIRSEFKVISEERHLTFRREGGGEIKTRPMVELAGHASDRLRDSLTEGRLLHVDLVDYIEEDFGFDEGKFIKTARRDLSLSISRSLPDGEGLKLIEKLKLYARRKGYGSMRVRWRDPELTRPQSARVDVARQDAGEAVFVKSSEIELDLPLPDISESISDELISKMKNLLD